MVWTDVTNLGATPRSSRGIDPSQKDQEKKFEVLGSPSKAPSFPTSTFPSHQEEIQDHPGLSRGSSGERRGNRCCCGRKPQEKLWMFQLFLEQTPGAKIFGDWVQTRPRWVSIPSISSFPGINGVCAGGGNLGKFRHPWLGSAAGAGS